MSSRRGRMPRAAASVGFFSGEFQPVHIVDETGDRTVSADETVRATTTIEGLGSLSPSFADPALAARFPEIEWKITPGNSSPLTDGASAVLIASAAAVVAHGLTPRARFHGFAVVGSSPLYVLDGPVPATQKVLQRAGSLSRTSTHMRSTRRSHWCRCCGSTNSTLTLRSSTLEAGDRARPRTRCLRYATADNARPSPRGDRRPVRLADDVRLRFARFFRARVDEADLQVGADVQGGVHRHDSSDHPGPAIDFHDADHVGNVVSQPRRCWVVHNDPADAHVRCATAIAPSCSLVVA